MSTGSVQGFTFNTHSPELYGPMHPRQIEHLRQFVGPDQPCQCFRRDCHHGDDGCGSAPIRHYHGDTPLCDRCAAHMLGTGAKVRAVPAR